MRAIELIRVKWVIPEKPGAPGTGKVLEEIRSVMSTECGCWKGREWSPHTYLDGIALCVPLDATNEIMGPGITIPGEGESCFLEGSPKFPSSPSLPSCFTLSSLPRDDLSFFSGCKALKGHIAGEEACLCRGKMNYTGFGRLWRLFHTGHRNKVIKWAADEQYRSAHPPPAMLSTCLGFWRGFIALGLIKYFDWCWFSWSKPWG